MMNQGMMIVSQYATYHGHLFHAFLVYSIDVEGALTIDCSAKVLGQLGYNSMTGRMTTKITGPKRRNGKPQLICHKHIIINL